MKKKITSSIVLFMNNIKVDFFNLMSLNLSYIMGNKNHFFFYWITLFLLCFLLRSVNTLYMLSSRKIKWACHALRRLSESSQYRTRSCCMSYCSILLELVHKITISKLMNTRRRLIFLFKHKTNESYTFAFTTALKWLNLKSHTRSNCTRIH